MDDMGEALMFPIPTPGRSESDAQTVSKLANRSGPGSAWKGGPELEESWDRHVLTR